MTKESELRGMIGRKVEIRGKDGTAAFAGKLLGKLDVWRDARPDLVSAGSRHLKLWAAIRNTGGQIEQFHFSANRVDVSLAV